jgi:hypothetical protein
VESSYPIDIGGIKIVNVKGSVIIDAIKWARHKYGDQEIDQRINLLSPEAKSIFLGEIMRTEWYPLDAYVNFLELGFKEHYKNSTEYLNNVYHPDC